MQTSTRSDAEIGFEAGIEALDRLEPGLGQFALTVPWAAQALQQHGSLSPGKLDLLQRQYSTLTQKSEVPGWTLGPQTIIGSVRALRPGTHGPRMTIELRDGRRCFGPVPRRTEYVFRHALIQFETEIKGIAVDDPTFAFFNLPTALIRVEE